MNKKYRSTFLKCFFIFFYGFLFYSVTLFSQLADNQYKIRTVIIDAGHGGKDPGSLGKRTTEKAIALAIALKTGEYIRQNYNDVKIVFTRTTDTYVELGKRAQIANDNKGDLFISIHTNGNVNTHASGTESYVLGLHRSGENFEVAKKENSVILMEDDYSSKYAGFDPNSAESYIIFSLMQNLYFDQSIHMAALVQEQFRERAQRKDRGVKQLGLLVLAQTAMPGILVETGFITNPDEEGYLMSDEGQDYLASAIFRAFRNYKEIIESKNTLLASEGNVAVSRNDSSKSQAQESENAKTDTHAEAPVVDVPVVEFKVQIVASSKQIALTSREFKGLSGICEYRAGNFYKYAVGSGRTFQEIIPYSKQVKEKFPDAFIIAVKENKIIPLDQALKESGRN